jgi:hypothetical protein
VLAHEQSIKHLHYLRHNCPEHILAFAPTRERQKEMILKKIDEGWPPTGNGQWHGLFFRFFFRLLFDLPGIHIFMF